MKITTNCVIVNRAYYFEVSYERFELVRVKEFIFKHDDLTRRYCMVLDKKHSHIYEITEHSPSFFDKVVDASCGWCLYNLYHSEKLVVVPVAKYSGFVSHSKKYQYLKEFYVIFNSRCNEKTMKSLAHKNHVNLETILYDSE